MAAAQVQARLEVSARRQSGTHPVNGFTVIHCMSDEMNLRQRDIPYNHQ
jgi:hypothetical protein